MENLFEALRSQKAATQKQIVKESIAADDTLVINSTKYKIAKVDKNAGYMLLGLTVDEYEDASGVPMEYSVDLEEIKSLLGEDVKVKNVYELVKIDDVDDASPVLGFDYEGSDCCGYVGMGNDVYDSDFETMIKAMAWGL